MLSSKRGGDCILGFSKSDFITGTREFGMFSKACIRVLCSFNR